MRRNHHEPPINRWKSPALEMRMNQLSSLAARFRVALLIALVCVFASGCRPKKVPTAAAAPSPAKTEPAKSEPATAANLKAHSTEEGIATWYDVPDGSIPERRAPGLFTAAHKRLPIGSYA